MPKSSQEGHKKGKKEAFIITSFTVTKEQFDYIQGLTDGLNDDIVRLFRHILASTFIQSKDYDGIVPVSAILIRKKLPKAEFPAWTILQERELMTYIDSSQKDNKSRRFIISSEVIIKFMALTPLNKHTEEAYKEYAKAPKVNLMSGLKAIPKKSTVYLSNGNSASKLVCDAIRTIKTGYFDLPATTKLMQRAKDTAIDLWESDDKPGFAFNRYVNDFACVGFLLARIIHTTRIECV